MLVRCLRNHDIVLINCTINEAEQTVHAALIQVHKRKLTAVQGSVQQLVEAKGGGSFKCAAAIPQDVTELSYDYTIPYTALDSAG